MPQLSPRRRFLLIVAPVIAAICLAIPVAAQGRVVTVQAAKKLFKRGLTITERPSAGLGTRIIKVGRCSRPKLPDGRPHPYVVNCHALAFWSWSEQDEIAYWEDIGFEGQEVAELSAEGGGAIANAGGSITSEWASKRLTPLSEGETWPLVQYAFGSPYSADPAEVFARAAAFLSK